MCQVTGAWPVEEGSIRWFRTKTNKTTKAKSAKAASEAAATTLTVVAAAGEAVYAGTGTPAEWGQQRQRFLFSHWTQSNNDCVATLWDQIFPMKAAHASELI